MGEVDRPAAAEAFCESMTQIPAAGLHLWGTQDVPVLLASNRATSAAAPPAPRCACQWQAMDVWHSLAKLYT